MATESSARRRMAAATLGIAMGLTACGSGGGVPDSPAAAAASEAAAGNIDNLQQSNNVFDIELLDVSDGSISTLGQTIDGDRPVLLWFYSPH